MSCVVALLATWRSVVCRRLAAFVSVANSVRTAARVFQLEEGLMRLSLTARRLELSWKKVIWPARIRLWLLCLLPGCTASDVDAFAREHTMALSVRHCRRPLDEHQQARDIWS